mgnify:CR=1 FL=1
MPSNRVMPIPGEIEKLKKVSVISPGEDIRPINNKIQRYKNIERRGKISE